MAKKATKEESVLGFAAIEAPPRLSSELVPFGQSNRALTRDQKRVTEEFGRQELIIEATGAKTAFGQDEIGEITQNGGFVFTDTVSYLFELKDEAHGKEYQPYVDEFTKVQVRTLAKHLMGTIEVGAVNIGAVINQSLDLPPEKPSLWKRLFG